MDDKTLLNIAIITSMIGIIVLLSLAFFDKIPEKKFNEITSKDVDSKVTIKGSVKQIYPHNNSVSIRMEQNCFIDVTSFEKNLSISIGDNLTIQGTVQEYNNKISILADRIKK